jgi:hypothetical protein
VCVCVSVCLCVCVSVCLCVCVCRTELLHRLQFQFEMGRACACFLSVAAAAGNSCFRSHFGSRPLDPMELQPPSNDMEPRFAVPSTPARFAVPSTPGLSFDVWNSSASTFAVPNTPTSRFAVPNTPTSVVTNRLPQTPTSVPQTPFPTQPVPQTRIPAQHGGAYIQRPVGYTAALAQTTGIADPAPGARPVAAAEVRVNSAASASSTTSSQRYVAPASWHLHFPPLAPGQHIPMLLCEIAQPAHGAPVFYMQYIYGAGRSVLYQLRVEAVVEWMPRNPDGPA